MCQYELWVYTRCRSTTPPIPPLPSPFPQHLLSLPPDQMDTTTTDADTGLPTAAASLQNTYPHTSYYRVTKCPLSPECAPPTFTYLAPPPPPSPRLKRRMLAAAQSALLKASPSPIAVSPSKEEFQTNAITPLTPVAAEQLQSHGSRDMSPPIAYQPVPVPQHPIVPVHIRHSYCHTCYDILKESIDGDGELCFPIGSDNWLNETGKSTGKCWIMDDRAARGDIIVDLDYSTGIDWGVEFEAYKEPADSPIPAEVASQPSSKPLEQPGQTKQRAAAGKIEKDLRAQEAARAREKELLRERLEKERLRRSLATNKELGRRKARILAENLRKRRWKGWEAWGSPYVLSPAPRTAKAGAS